MKILINGENYEINENEYTKMFHNAFKAACDKYDPEYYPKFKKTRLACA